MEFRRKSMAITLAQLSNNPKPDLVNINAYTKFSKILSFRSHYELK